MRALLFFSFLITIFSCKKDAFDCKAIKYEESTTATYKDMFCLENGYEFEIIDVIDAYCPCHVTCILPGFLKVKISVTDNEQNTHKLEIHDASYLIQDTISNLDKFIPSFKNVKINNDDCSKPAKPENITFDLVVKEK